MRTEFKTLRIKQLDRDLEQFCEARAVARPAKGWLRAVREALGISARELGERLGTGHQLPLQLEKSEAEDAITLRSLRNAANAMECDLVYALVPRAGSMQQLIEQHSKSHALDEARKHVLGVEHSMALEGQAVGRIGEAIEAEAKRLAQAGRGVR